MRAPELGAYSVAFAISAALACVPPPAAAAKPKAELVITRLSDPPAVVEAGSEMTVRDRVANRRKRARRSENAYFLSDDRFRDLRDVKLDGSRPVPKLKRRDSSKGSAELRVPESTDAGVYRMLACADSTGRVRERSESNNCKAARKRVRIAPGSTPPGAPAIGGTSPATPSPDNQPDVTGTAAPGSTVKIYSSADCSGTPIGSGSAAEFGGAGIPVTVPENQTTELRATATDAAGNVSDCSPPFAYTEDSSAPGAPAITTDPASPANDNTPEVRGTAEAGANVAIYASALCTGSPIATGTAAELAAGITIPVADDSMTTLAAIATDAAGNQSACSAPIIYEEVSAGP